MSTPFRFSLERVRALREHTEDAAKEALAGAMADRDRSEQIAREATDAVDQARQAQLAVGAGPVNGHELLARQAYLERSERVQAASRERLGRSERTVAQRRAALTEAARDRQALERLKEHRRADHEQELARQESMVQDELALGVFRRREAAA